MHAEFFSDDEFREWAGRMSGRQVALLDSLRFRLGRRVVISPHPDALGRHLGPGSESAHNIDKWGEVLATDVFIPGVAYREQAMAVVDAAWQTGFTGIGLYTDTTFGGAAMPMFHFDTRPTAKMGTPATWGRVAGKYVSLQLAFQSLRLGGRDG